MKRIVITLILTQYLSAAIGQDTLSRFNRSFRSDNNTVRKHKLSKAERDIEIRDILIGKWKYHGGVWEFESKGTYQFFYRDTVRTSGTWRIKNGIIKTFKNWPGDKVYYEREKIIFYSIDTIKFKRIGSMNSDHVITISKLKN